MKTTELTLRHKVLPYLIPLLLIIQLVSPRKVWMILLVGISTIFVISFSWAKSLQNGIHFYREMRFGWSKVGDHLQERFEVSNTGWAPAVWVYMADHSDLAGYQASRVLYISAKSFRKWIKKGICERRGLYTIGPTSLYTGDPLGIFAVKIEYAATSNMMVMPQILSLPEIQIAPGGRIGEGINIANSWEQTVTVASVREYHPGDSLRYIHWPTSARKNELFVRTFDNTPTSDQWVFMDMNVNVNAGEGENASEEHGIILAASLMNWSLEDGHAVGFGANGKNLAWHRPSADETQKWKILRALALLEKGDEPLFRLLEVARQSLRSRSSLIIITADLGGSWLDPVLLMRKKGIIPTILLLNASEFGGEGDPSHLQNRLIYLGLNNYLINPDYLDNMGKRLSTENQKQRDEYRKSRKVHWRPLV
jgi:uncharacterized protein (DUF58 family)